MYNLNLSIHHIGGRAGSRAFPYMKIFERDIINVLYDADEDCLEQIKTRNYHLESQLHVLPYALSDMCKSAVLNINYDPYTSSLLESNGSMDSFYMFYKNHDYIWGETAKTVEKRNIEVLSIDHIFSSNSVTVPKPDFLSLDVEGSEYDILNGSIETMGSSILAIYAEVNFISFRNGERNFGELCEFLSAHGYYFVTFAKWMQEMSPYRYPLGLRGNSFQTLTEAVFLRKIDVVNELFSDPTERYINLLKLAFISMQYSQIEYGLECLRHSRAIGDEYKSRFNKTPEPKYFKFLKEIELAQKNHPTVYPKSFRSMYTYEKSISRFKDKKILHQNYKNKGFNGKAIAKQLPYVYNLYKMVLKIKNYFFKKINYIYLSASNTNFEKVFIKYGLLDQAKLIKRKRIAQQLNAFT